MQTIVLDPVLISPFPSWSLCFRKAGTESVPYVVLRPDRLIVVYDHCKSLLHGLTHGWSTFVWIDSEVGQLFVHVEASYRICLQLIIYKSHPRCIVVWLDLEYTEVYTCNNSESPNGCVYIFPQIHVATRVSIIM